MLFLMPAVLLVKLPERATSQAYHFDDTWRAASNLTISLVLLCYKQNKFV